MISPVYFLPAAVSEGEESLALKAEKLWSRLGLEEKIEKDSLVALKIHFGEKENTGHIKPSWLLRVVKRLSSRSRRVFYTDTNTLYTGPRSNAVEHLALAREHGFALDLCGVPVVIADGLIGNDAEEVVTDRTRIKKARIASGIVHADFLVCLTHVTGHIITGIGAAVKNLGMGCASRAGKLEQHSDVHPSIKAKACKNCSLCLDYCPAGAISQRDGSAVIDDDKCIGCGECLVVCKTGAVKIRWDEDTTRLQEKMAEYAAAVASLFKEKMGFINFLVNVTKDCDCMSKSQSPVVKDVGLLASLDPIALDTASAALILEKAGKDIFRKGYDVDWSVQLKYGQEIGLGSTEYELIELG